MNCKFSDGETEKEREREKKKRFEMRWSLDLEVKVWTCSNCPFLWMRLQTSSTLTKLWPITALPYFEIELGGLHENRKIRTHKLRNRFLHLHVDFLSLHQLSHFLRPSAVYVCVGVSVCVCVCVRHKALEKCGSTGVTADIWVLLQKSI